MSQKDTLELANSKKNSYLYNTLHQMVKEHPNDADLGKELRKFVNQTSQNGKSLGKRDVKKKLS